MLSISPRARRVVRAVVLDGTVAGLLSSAVLAWRGRHDDGSAAAPLNGPSQWVWGREALRRNDMDARHTLVGEVIHHGSGLLWAAFYGWLQSRRRRRSVANVVGDAALVAVLAAWVDLRLTPPRFTPGFEHRLTPRSLWMVYGSFGAGLAMAGLSGLHRRDRPTPRR